MTEHQFSQLLKDVTPQPPASIDFDRVAIAVRRRRRTLIATVASALAVLGGLGMGIATLSGSGMHHRSGPTAQPGAAVIASSIPSMPTPLYTVVATVQTTANGTSIICGPISPAVFSNALCGGVGVSGMPASIPNSRTVDGVTTTPTLRLTGHWRMGTLVLTTPPVPESGTSEAPSQPCTTSTSGSEVDLELMKRVADDRADLRSAGVEVYEVLPCGSTVLVEVPVADTATRELFRSRFGSSVVLIGWLQPVQ